MPPADSKKPLTDEQKQILTKWIKQGANYSQHWAFKAIKKSSPPNTGGAAWPRNVLDQSVLAELNKKEITPAPEAERRVWLRRVTQDLTGLPPTLEQLDTFLADRSPQAYEKVIDRLLTSTDYAERMTTIWLDNARYADSNDFNFDNVRKMWPWRDWVINAYRTNMPYDRFVTEQLAGDLLPDATDAQRIATGFNRNHGFTIEGGVIAEEYRVMYVNDISMHGGTDQQYRPGLPTVHHVHRHVDATMRVETG